MKVLAFSSIDPAGSGIAKSLLNIFKHKETRLSRALRAWYLEDVNAILAEFEEDVVYFNFLDEVFPNAEYFIILSRHSASSGVKSLTVHHTGNPVGEALLGGNPYELAYSNPKVSYSILVNISKLAVNTLPDFKVVYEVTHHGPTNVKKPLTFVEIGSSELEWSLNKAHETLAQAVGMALMSSSQVDCVPTVGFGGPHYAEQFTNRALTLRECYGHIISRYAINELTQHKEMFKNVVLQALEKNADKVEKVVIAKMRSEDRIGIVNLCVQKNLSYVYVK